MLFPIGLSLDSTTISLQIRKKPQGQKDAFWKSLSILFLKTDGKKNAKALSTFIEFQR